VEFIAGNGAKKADDRAEQVAPVSSVEDIVVVEDSYHKDRIANRRLHPETLMMGYGRSCDCVLQRPD
jgi:hypothetical protein